MRIVPSHFPSAAVNGKADSFVISLARFTTGRPRNYLSPKIVSPLTRFLGEIGATRRNRDFEKSQVQGRITVEGMRHRSLAFAGRPFSRGNKEKACIGRPRWWSCLWRDFRKKRVNKKINTLLMPVLAREKERNGHRARVLSERGSPCAAAFFSCPLSEKLSVD